MVDVGWFEYDLPRWSEFGDPVGHQYLVVATGVVEVFGRVAVEHDATLLFAAPGQGPVHRSLVEDYQDASFEWDLVDQLLVGPVELDVLWAGII